MMLQPGSRLYYGLQAVIALARRPPDTPVSAREIAERQGISEKYLESLLATLRCAGIIQSQRGAGGGHLLSRSPRNISLRDVFLALDGQNEGDDDCADRPAERCVALRAWGRIAEHALAAMAQITIAELARESERLDADHATVYQI